MTGESVPSGPARILAVPSHGWSICNVLCYKWVVRLEGHARGIRWLPGGRRTVGENKGLAFGGGTV